MKNRIRGSWVFLLVLAGLLLAGCGPVCQTRSERSSFPLLWKSTYESTCSPNGSLDVLDQGRAVILVGWDYDRGYDSKGQLVRYKDHSFVWPLYDIHSIRCGQTVESHGTILLFYKFGQKKD